MARASLGLALLVAGPVLAQEGETGADPRPVDEFRQTAIPDDVGARFVCHQYGAEILSVDGVSSFAPARMQGVTTFSICARDGSTRLIYPGDTTAFELVVEGG